MDLGLVNRGTQEDLGTTGGLLTGAGGRVLGGAATNRGRGCGLAAMQQQEAAAETPTTLDPQVSAANLLLFSPLLFAAVGESTFA